MLPTHLTERLQLFADPRFRFDAEPHEYYLGERQLTNFSTWIKDYKKPFDREGQSLLTAVRRGIATEAVLAEWDRSQWVGTKTHEFIANYYATGGCPLVDAEPDPEVALRCEKFLQLRADRLQSFLPVAQELPIFHEASGLCGTLDFLAWHLPSQQLYVLDWKTNTKIATDQDRAYRNLLGPFADLIDHEHNVYSLQISLYRLLLEEAGIETAGGAIVHLPGGDAPAVIYQAINYRARLRALLF